MSFIQYFYYLAKMKFIKTSLKIEMRGEVLKCYFFRIFYYRSYIRYTYYKQMIQDMKISSEDKIKDILEESKNYKQITEIEKLVNNSLEKDTNSKYLVYYKLAVYFKDEINLLLAKECYLKCFDIFKENNLNLDYSKIEILNDYVKLLFALGEIEATEVNFIHLIQNCITYNGIRNEQTINVLRDFVELKIFLSQNEAAIGYMEYINSFLNPIKFYNKNVFSKDLQFKIKSNLFLLYYINGFNSNLKKLLNQLHKLIKELKIYDNKDILYTFTGNETEEHLEEVEKYITYSILQSKYLQIINQNKEAQALLEKSAIICKKNPKRFNKLLIDINVDLISIHKQNQSEEYKYLQNVEENLSVLRKLNENRIENAISLMNFSEILINLNQFGKAYEFILLAEKKLSSILDKDDKNMFFARLNFLYGVYYSKKNDYENGEKYLNKSLETFETILKNYNYSNLVKLELADLYERREKENKLTQTEDSSHEKIIRVDLNEDKKTHTNSKKSK